MLINININLPRFIRNISSCQNFILLVSFFAFSYSCVAQDSVGNNLILPGIDTSIYSSLITSGKQLEVQRSEETKLSLLGIKENKDLKFKLFSKTWKRNTSHNFHFKDSIRKKKFSLFASSAESETFQLRNYNAPLRKKFGRGELFIGGIEMLGMGILILLPKHITKWEDDWMKDAMRNLKTSWSKPPIWDKDDWGLNYIGHPVAGSYYYNALRSQNATIVQSFAFSTLQSNFWEYVVEGVAERPSIQDLIITPLGGALLGEATHLLTLGMRKNGFNFAEKAFVVVFNPLYAINNGLGKKRSSQKNNFH